MGESRSSCFCASEADQPVRFLFFPLSLSTRGGLGNFALPGKRYTTHSLRIISLHKHKVFVYVVLGVWPGALLNFTSPVTFFSSLLVFLQRSSTEIHHSNLQFGFFSFNF